MDSTHSITGGASSKQHSWGRDQISQLIQQIRLDRLDGVSLNSSASEHHVARTTAQNWLRNRCRLEQQSGLDPTAVEFFRITPRARVPTQDRVRFPSRRRASQRWRYTQYLLAARVVPTGSIYCLILWGSAEECSFN